jgi:hypothetical protein
MNYTDPLWPYFERLWQKFSKAGKPIFIAGGYGLFLKQQHLLNTADSRVVIPLAEWPDSAPRATRDMDLVLSLDLIADAASNKLIASALDEEGFEVSRSASGKRRKFFKDLGDDKSVIVEFHATAPEEEIDTVKSNRFTVKHKPSLGDEGVHGRTNQEAVGSEIAPFNFTINDVLVSVPHPVTWSVMKLTAAHDMWTKFEDTDVAEVDKRQYFREQAIKHGHDVCRAIAMMTIEESDRSEELLEAIRDTTQFKLAGEIYHDFFDGADEWATNILSALWQEDQLDIIKSILSEWYKL